MSNPILEKQAWFSKAAAPFALIITLAAAVAAIIIPFMSMAASMTYNYDGLVIPWWTALIAGAVAVTLGTSLRIQNPNDARVFQFFGEYIGTVRATGLYMTYPFMSTVKLSVKDLNFETPTSKVNDMNGNPINISAVVVWRVIDTAKAIFSVENYVSYLQTQAEAAVRHIAAAYPYDSADKMDEQGRAVPSLLGNSEEVNSRLQAELTERAANAGVQIVEVRINNLAYAPEIAQSMLQRQQAAALIDARKIVVEGALGIVEDTVAHLKSQNSTFSPEAQGSLTNDLLLVLVGESKVTPTLSVGSNAGRK